MKAMEMAHISVAAFRKSEWRVTNIGRKLLKLLFGRRSRPHLYHGEHFSLLNKREMEKNRMKGQTDHW